MTDRRWLWGLIATGVVASIVAVVVIGPWHSTPEASDPRTQGAQPQDAHLPEQGAHMQSSDSEALEGARAAAKQLGGALKMRLVSAMGEGGPQAALRVCASDAQTIAADVAETTEVRVGRSSLRLRNPQNQGPPWVTQWLADQGDRSAEGVEGFARIEDGHARVLVPIAVEGVCLNCHGPREGLSEEVRSSLQEHYPDDQATGYTVSDLRGALWAEADL